METIVVVAAFACGLAVGIVIGLALMCVLLSWAARSGSTTPR